MHGYMDMDNYGNDGRLCKTGNCKTILKDWSNVDKSVIRAYVIFNFI